MTGPEIKQSLLAADPEFRRLAEEHFLCETKLEEILNSAYLNSEVLIEETNLKKKKLRLKDQMEQIIAHSQHLLQH
jgi:uncharacterized protein YdcH (DUF465 family)